MSKRLHFVAAVFVFLIAVRLDAAYSKTQDFRPATPEELAMQSAPSAPGAPAAILDWVRIDDDTNSYSAEYKRIKIFTDEGKKYADIEITYSPGYPYYGSVAGIDARTIRPDGKIVPFTGKVYDKVLLKGGGVRLQAKTFTLPDVQPGSIIEYRFTRRWTDSIVLPTHWSISQDIPVLHAKLTLKPYNSFGEYRTFFTYLGLPKGKEPKHERGQWEIELENIPAYEAEAFAPPEQQLRGYLNFYYTRENVNAEQYWDEEAKSSTKRIEDFIGKLNHAMAAAQPLAGANKKETAKKVYAFVQSLRNYSFEEWKTDQELNKQNIDVSKNVAAVLKKKAGYSSELNRTFVAVARAAGLQADVVRVAPRDEFFFSKKIPDGEQMSGEIAVVTIDGQPYYLDPGTPHAPFGTISWEKTNVPGIRVSKGKPPEWVTTPQNSPSDAMVKRTAELAVNGETLEGKVVVTFTGQEALRRRLRHLTDDEAARTKAYEEEAAGWLPEGSTVKLGSLTGATSIDDTVVATFDVVLPNAITSAGSRTLIPMSVFETRARNPFAPTTRKHAIYFEYPRTEEDEVKLTVPESFKVAAVPPPVNMNAGALAYKSEVKQDGNTVTLKRSSSVKVMLIEPKFYEPLRSYFSAVLTADQKPLVLTAKE